MAIMVVMTKRLINYPKLEQTLPPALIKRWAGDIKKPLIAFEVADRVVFSLPCLFKKELAPDGDHD